MVAQTLEKGYRQTEIGAIPDDWDIDRIKNLANITTGSRNTQDRIDDGKYPFFVRSQNVERIDTYSFDGEAVLTAGDGVGTGKVFHYINGKFDFHQRVYKISKFNERLDGYFFYLYFSNAFLKRIMSMTAKSSVDSVRMEMIADMLIPLPKKDEQLAIAKTISDMAALTESMEKLIEKKKNIKQGAMQELLTGKNRPLGFDDQWKLRRYKLTDVGIIPEDWAVENILDNSTLKARIGWQGLTTAEYLSNGTFILVTGTDFHSGKINWDTCVYVDRKRYSQDRNIQLRAGDVLVTKDGTIGKVAYITVLPLPATLNSGIFVIRPKEKAYSPLFLFYVLSSDYFAQFLNKLMAGSTINHLYQKDFASFSFVVPEFSEQERIAQVLSSIDSEIEALEKKRDKFKQLKIGMMQQLLIGRIRLKWKN
jgi:type I restriction enzyme S subunit